MEGFDAPYLRGIENVVKYKYRNTVPKYPKPGVFYWVEQEIDGRDKLSIYFTTNDYELRRLDSKIYSLTTKLDDSGRYIVITEPNKFDEQEIYLVMGNFNKQDEITEDGVRTFRIIPDDMGLTTVEDVVEYVSDSNNMLYISNVPDFYNVGVRLGDIRIGYNKDTLKNETISEILDRMIYPTLQPVIPENEPSVTLSEKLISLSLKEGEEEQKLEVVDVQTNIQKIFDRFNKSNLINSSEKYITCSRGELTYVTEELDKDGKMYVLKNYAGEPILTTNGSNNEMTLNLERPDELDGTYKFSVSVYFKDGPQPLDNKRNFARFDDKVDTCDCESGCEKCQIPPFKGNYIKSNELSFNVVYPIFVNAGDNIHYMDNYKPLDYISDDVEEIIEFPYEVDGFDENTPYKMCIDIPHYLECEVYQYNEISNKYNVKKKMEFVKTVVHNGINYNRYMRTTNPFDTKTDSVKYKIIIKKK